MEFPSQKTQVQSRNQKLPLPPPKSHLQLKPHLPPGTPPRNLLRPLPRNPRRPALTIQNQKHHSLRRNDLVLDLHPHQGRKVLLKSQHQDR